MFLLKKDFFQFIAETDFNKLIGYNQNGDVIWINEVPRAIETISGYIRARYDVSEVFKNTNDFDSTLVYTAGQYVWYNDLMYKCILASETAQSITDTTYWIQEDYRNPKIIELVADICLYNFFSRLNSVDIPTYRKERYDGNSDKQIGGAIGYLKNVSKGNIEPNLPLRTAGQTDQTGNKIIYGNAELSFANKYTF
jgi:hypothetical protein